MSDFLHIYTTHTHTDTPSNACNICHGYIVQYKVEVRKYLNNLYICGA